MRRERVGQFGRNLKGRGMDHWSIWMLAGAIGVFAGFVKGATGFALPMILISGLGSFMAPELALAILILPTVLSNVWQSLRGGIAGAKAALRKHWRYVGITMVFILLSAQLVTILPARAIFLVLGVPVLLLSLVQLVAGRRISTEHASTCSRSWPRWCRARSAACPASGGRPPSCI